LSDKSWVVELDGRRHEIRVQHSYFSARRQIFVDGSRIMDIRPGPLTALRWWNTATEHTFVVAEHPCSVRIDPTVDNATYHKELSVDGRDVETGAPVASPRLTRSGTREGSWWLVPFDGVAVPPSELATTVLAQLAALAAIALGQISSQVHREPLYVIAGFVGAVICWLAVRIVGDDPLRKTLLRATVVAVLLVATWR